MIPPEAAPAGTPPRWALMPHTPPAPAEPIARAWLGERLGVAAESLALERDGRGRPRLGGRFAGLDCNWSHSGERLLVALGAGVRIGADLERLRARPRALELARRFFAPEEAAWLERVSATGLERAFTRLWCAKEALLKAHGHGLSFGLERAVFRPEGDGLALVACDAALGVPADWTLHIFEPEAGYLAAVAWRATPAPGA